MRQLQAFNALLLVAALGSATIIMGMGRVQEADAPRSSSESTQLRFGTTDDGSPTLIDSTGVGVRLDKRYQRVVAGSIVARSAMGELAEKERIVGIIAAGIEDAPDAHRFSGIPRLTGMDETERLVSLSPDLIIVSSLSSIPHIRRLRDSGIAVFTLGNMTGVESFLRDIRQIAHLIGARERGERLAVAYKRRMQAVAKFTPLNKRKSAIYLSAYGTQMFGGTEGTSYHDVLTYAGLVDRAADDFTGWPQYSPEHVLSLNPEVIVSPKGVPAFVCSHSSMGALRACQNGRAGFVELPSSWLEDPSLIMLDVAETVHEAVYGAP